MKTAFAAVLVLTVAALAVSGCTPLGPGPSPNNAAKAAGDGGGSGGGMGGGSGGY
jgi:hypothetical protein